MATEHDLQATDEHFKQAAQIPAQQPREDTRNATKAAQATQIECEKKRVDFQWISGIDNALRVAGRRF